jgi:hypothetical protein
MYTLVGYHLTTHNSEGGDETKIFALAAWSSGFVSAFGAMGREIEYRQVRRLGDCFKKLQKSPKWSGNFFPRLKHYFKLLL